MKKRDLADILRDAGLSAEDLGRRLDISGMTIRRWLNGDPEAELGPLYDAIVRDTVLRLLVEGKIDGNSPTVARILSAYEPLGQNAAISLLGLNAEQLQSNEGADFSETLVSGLTKIGDDFERRESVRKQLGALRKFKKLSSEWAKRLDILKEALTSNELLASEKLVAFGALFYLFCTFDLIPDFIPVFGLMDDFAVVGIAAAYYVNRTRSKQELEEA